MGSEAMQAAKVYRSLLKAVKKHIGNEGSKRHFRDYITEEFRKNASVSDQATVENKIKLAHEYTFLLNSVHHHKRRQSNANAERPDKQTHIPLLTFEVGRSSFFPLSEETNLPALTLNRY
ncbi:hypothetical protein B296_00018908 [Ensete ventricosum]|uniref:Complex 1 LYR protein domain-containing protein n=1 Tax=Ensete ventricosum TaxID=4639 RepID=A0A427B3B9_ENSVE|nr:hypothetical protein B296_00018908 [Ensete ventricosum]